MEKPGKKTKKKEDHVENIYGVHFKYKDLFNRLLKVQKERRCSEVNPTLKTIGSFDGNFKRNNSTKTKSNHSKLQKRSNSGVNTKNSTKTRKTSKKSSTRQLVESKRYNIFKTFSPSQAAKSIKLALKTRKEGKENIQKISECKLK
jgi:hypothetical protein